MDSEDAVAVAADTQVACMRGCRFLRSESNAILRQERNPKIAILKIRWAAVKPIVWRYGTFIEVSNSLLRVALKENPSPPVKFVEAPSVMHAESTETVLKETHDAVIKERHSSPAGIKRCASSVFEETPADKKQTTISDSSYAGVCHHRGEIVCFEIGVQALLRRKGCQDEVFCHASMSLPGTYLMRTRRASRGWPPMSRSGWASVV